MIKDLYDILETTDSKKAIEILVNKLPEPIILLGGWAVYLTVNELFEKENGYPYLGSKDVDIGFHIDQAWSNDELAESSFAKAMNILLEIGYIPSGTSRFLRIINRETEETLTEEQAKSIPQFNLFYLYVDPIVDIIHPKHYEVFSIEPIDEPLLSVAFEKERFETMEYENIPILIPTPEILIATKLMSFLGRDKEDKRIKDACDIYSLLWYSPIGFNELLNSIKENHPDLCNHAKGIIIEDVATKASMHLGIDIQTFIGVIKQLLG